MKKQKKQKIYGHFAVCQKGQHKAKMPFEQCSWLLRRVLMARHTPK
jgi:hypothetical protein